MTTRETLWRALLDARQWNESLLDSLGGTDPAYTATIKARAVATKKLQEKIFGTSEDSFSAMLKAAKSVSIHELKSLADNREPT